MNNADFTKTLPFSMDAERGVICSFLLSPATVGPLLAERGLSTNHFHFPAHQELYSTLLAMWAEGVPVDFITLTEAVARKGVLEQVGGAARITDIFMAVPTAANVEHYQKIVSADYTLREIIKTCNTATQESYERSSDPEVIISTLSERVMGLCTNTTQEVQTPKEMAWAALERYQQAMDHKGKPLGVTPTDFTDLDTLLCGGLRGGDFILITAPTKGGKSILADNIMERVTVENGHPGLLITLETRVDERVDRIISSMSRVGATVMRQGWFKEIDLQRIQRAAAKFAAAPIAIRNDLSSLAQIVGGIRQKKQKFPNLKLVVVDYLQLIEEQQAKNENREVVVARISTTLRRLALQLDISILFLSQENDDGRARESRRLEQDCTMWIQLETPKEEGVKLAKVRLNRNGPPGFFKLTHLKDCLRFENFAHNP